MIELTNREMEVLKLVALGSVNKEAAKQLGISPKTVEKHRTAILRKTDTHSSVKLVHWALSRGHVTNLYAGGGVTSHL